MDSGQAIVRHHWVVLPVPPAVIDHVNLLCKNEPSILTFTNQHDQDIGDLAQDFEPRVNEDEDSFVAHPIDKLPGVDVRSGDAELPRVDTDFDAKWRWILKPMEMSPKSRTRYMALNNKIPLGRRLKLQMPNQPLFPLDSAAQQREDQPGWPRIRPPTHRV